MSGPALSIRGASAGYGGRVILDTLTIELPVGACCAVLGPNGAGKSTLLRLIGGQLPPRAGSVEIMGRALEAWPPGERARRVAGLPGDADTPLPLTVRELAGLGRAPHRSAWAPGDPGREHPVEQALADLELLPLSDARLDCLSAGERQRAFLALALAQEPELLLLDEPTAHLDLRHAATFMRLLRARANAGRTTSVFSTHDLQRAADAATHVALLKGGRLLACGPAEGVLTAELLGEAFETTVEVRLEGGRRWIRAA